MNLRMWKGILDSEVATIIFPTTLDEVQKEVRGLEEFGSTGRCVNANLKL